MLSGHPTVLTGHPRDPADHEPEHVAAELWELDERGRKETRPC